MKQKVQNLLFNCLFLLAIFTMVILFSESSEVNAQSVQSDFGARSNGIGNANTTLTDEWSVLNNVGGISAIGSGSVFFGYQRYFDIEGFDRVGAGIIQY
jgi:hypothetical protein